MIKLIKYLKGYEAESILAPFFKFLEAVFELLVPIIIANIIDKGIAFSDTKYIWEMGMVLLALGVLGLASALTAQYFSAKTALGFGTAVRSEMFKHINNFSSKEIDKFGTSSLITRMTSDINNAQAGINMFLRLFMRAPFIVIGALVSSFIIDIRMGFIFLAATPAIALSMYIIVKITMPLYTKTQEGMEKLALLTRENLSGARVIRAFSKQKDETDNFEKNADELQSWQIKANRISALNNPMTYVIVNCAILFILYAGGNFVEIGSLTQGQVLALINYMIQISMAMMAVSVLVIIMTKASASSQRINEVFQSENSVIEGAMNMKNGGEFAIEFENVDFRYAQGSKNALSGINFKIKKGERIGIIGVTGSGKTTLINLIIRAYDATEGNIKVLGSNIRNLSFKQLKSRIGLAMQKTILFEGTIKENMLLARENLSDKQIFEALEAAQAEEIVREKGGLDAQVKQKGVNFSGGQKQRLSIARAIAGSPDIIIFDDSTSALDYYTESQLRKAMDKHSPKSAIIYVSQRIGTVKNCDKIIVMDNGIIVGIGIHDKLIQNCDEYIEIYKSQTAGREL